MFSSFLNPGMLIGLLGIGLPILVHILSRRHSNTIAWGAMQFLQTAPRTRRMQRLEQLVLLALRIALVAVLVFAFARPWVSGRRSWFASSAEAAQDIVIVVDGSLSMQADASEQTFHRRAIEHAQQLLADFSVDDTFSVIDARDIPRVETDGLTQDKLFASRILDDLPQPAGSVDVLAAMQRAVTVLSRGQHQNQRIVFLTDNQAHGWLKEGIDRWQQFRKTCDDLGLSPVISVVNLGELPQVNYGIGPLELSDEQTVVGRPLKIRSQVQGYGNKQPVTLTVNLEVEGSVVESQQQQVTVPPHGAVEVFYEHRFESAGEKLISLVIDDDSLAGDNSAAAVVDVQESLKVLLVNGTPSSNPVKRETYFLETALGKQNEGDTWVGVQQVDWDRWEQTPLDDFDVILLANVPQFSDAGIETLTRFVTHGGGLLWAVGDQVNARSYNRRLYQAGQGLVPAALGEIKTATKDFSGGLRLQSSENANENGAPLLQSLFPQSTTARFRRWWSVDDAVGNQSGRERQSADVVARLENDAPFLVRKTIGRGQSFLLTVPLDADWSNLPAKPEWVPFVYELLFQLKQRSVSRNRQVGQPLVLDDLSAAGLRQTDVIDSAGKSVSVNLQSKGKPSQLLSAPTFLPGVYRMVTRGEGKERRFVVEFDRRETNLTELTTVQKNELSKAADIQFLTHDNWEATYAAGNDVKAELWPYLLLVFVGLFVVESWWTRWLVKKGYAM